MQYGSLNVELQTLLGFLCEHGAPADTKSMSFLALFCLLPNFGLEAYNLSVAVSIRRAWCEES